MQNGFDASVLQVAYVADNSLLVDETQGLGYLDSKEADPDGKRIANAGVLWGSVVHGIDEGDWIRVGEKYLPTKIRGCPVLVRSPAHDVVRDTNLKMEIASIQQPATRAEDMRIDLAKINKKDPKQSYTYGSKNIFTRGAGAGPEKNRATPQQTPRLSSKGSAMAVQQTPRLSSKASAVAVQTPMVTPRRSSIVKIKLRDGRISTTTITETCENCKFVDISDSSGIEIGDYITVGDEEFRIKSTGHCLVGLDKGVAKLHPVGTCVTIRASDPLGAVQKRPPIRLSLGSSSAQAANVPSRQLMPSGLGEGSKEKNLNSAARRRSY